MSDAAHRVDLVIETEATIIALEAKIRAPADKDQLARYDRELKERARQKGTHLLIYLGPRLVSVASRPRIRRLQRSAADLPASSTA